jgi:hypothetical protein
MSHESFRLPPFPPEYRATGLLLHVTSLPSPCGIGEVGPAALALDGEHAVRLGLRTAARSYERLEPFEGDRNCAHRKNTGGRIANVSATKFGFIDVPGLLARHETEVR